MCMSTKDQRVMMRNGLSGRQASQNRRAKSHVVNEIENHSSNYKAISLSSIL